MTDLFGAGENRFSQSTTRGMQAEVCILGAGAIGLCTAALLAYAGVQCVVIERDTIGSGATGNNAGVLHSGARYAVADPVMASQCLGASERLAQFAPHSVTNMTWAYYLIIDRSSEDYAAQFLDACARIGIPTECVDRADVCHQETILDEKCIRGAIAVPDRIVDPFALLASYEQFLHGVGASIYQNAQVFNAVCQRGSWKISLVDTESGDESVVRTPVVLVAAGAWSPNTLQQFGVRLGAKYIKGSIFVIKPVLSSRILCISNLPASGDMLVPCGAASLLGSTWERQDNPDPTPPSHQELKSVIQPFSSILRYDLVSRITHAYSGVRVVLARLNKPCPEGWDRTPQDAFIFDHELEHDVPGLLSAFGGKLATHLETATAVADLILRKRGYRVTRSSRLAVLPPADRKPNRSLEDIDDLPHHWRVAW